MKNVCLLVVATVIFSHSFISARKGNPAHNLAMYKIDTKEDAERVLHKVLYCIKTEVKEDRPALRAAVFANKMALETVLGPMETASLLSCIQGNLPPHVHG